MEKWWSPTISGWILWFGVDITTVKGVYKPTCNWGGPRWRYQDVLLRMESLHFEARSPIINYVVASIFESRGYLPGYNHTWGFGLVWKWGIPEYPISNGCWNVKSISNEGGQSSKRCWKVIQPNKSHVKNSVFTWTQVRSFLGATGHDRKKYHDLLWHMDCFMYIHGFLNPSGTAHRLDPMAPWCHGPLWITTSSTNRRLWLMTMSARHRMPFLWHFSNLGHWATGPSLARSPLPEAFGKPTLWWFTSGFRYLEALGQPILDKAVSIPASHRSHLSHRSSKACCDPYFEPSKLKSCEGKYPWQGNTRAKSWKNLPLD